MKPKFYLQYLLVAIINCVLYHFVRPLAFVVAGIETFFCVAFLVITFSFGTLVPNLVPQTKEGKKLQTFINVFTILSAWAFLFMVVGGL